MYLVNITNFRNIKINKKYTRRKIKIVLEYYLSNISPTNKTNFTYNGK